MPDKLPDYLAQGEVARLFPVLSTTSKEGRTTSIVLACLAAIPEFGKEVLASIGQKTGVRTGVDVYTEVVFTKHSSEIKDRPDGLITLKNRSGEWRALIEAKVANSKLEADQIERYRVLAKDNGVDCVITLSNQFATNPNIHPLEEVRKSRSKIPVFHWSWMHILTTVDLLLSQGRISDAHQRDMLNELRRFLSHESAGVKGFDRMPAQWSDLNKLVSSGGTIAVRSGAAIVSLNAWHQETRDLSLILSRLTETGVTEKLSSKHRNDVKQRQKDELDILRKHLQLRCVLAIPNAAAPVEISADLRRRCLNVGMSLRAPENKVTTKARLNWVLRQIKGEDQDLYIRLHWPGTSQPSQFPLGELRENVEIATVGKEHLSPRAFHVFLSRRIGAKFTQQTNFISELERIVPEFYRNIGSELTAWKKSAPRIKGEKSLAEDVSPEAISDDAEDFGR
ncbi:MAG: hypothetical protein GXP03_05785 [Alphaproteobacteria bacterium]|nr:hypothetical protein [Alphaproteobacteria bacterium]